MLTKMHIRFLLTVLFCLSASCTFAQSKAGFEIHGYLKASKTLDPCEYTSVIVEGTYYGALTDDHGSFTIMLPEHPKTDSVAFTVRSIELGEQKLVIACPPNVDQWSPSLLVVAPEIVAIRNPGGDGGHGGRGEDYMLPKMSFGHGSHPDWSINIIRKVGFPPVPGQYYVDREGIVWKIAYY